MECTELANNREDIPSLNVAKHFTHLESIHEVMDKVEVDILIGRYLINPHIVQGQREGTRGMPYGQKLPLGWVLIKPVCVDALHIPEGINMNKIFILENGHPSILQPCENKGQHSHKNRTL
jgi:hypothetical protein